ncbi:hypothetical protein [Clostridium sp. DJ247]|nr:hypothetical protein [Clostridium sp. DJ247]MBC2582155.1 hypothetical protein [Clostridium sp. DJ247]
MEKKYILFIMILSAILVVSVTVKATFCRSGSHRSGSRMDKLDLEKFNK